MMRTSLLLVAIPFVWATSALAGGERNVPENPAAPAGGGTVDFLKDVAPVFARHCQSCHGPNKQESGLRLDEKKAALSGGDSGPAIVPGKPADSELLRRIASTDLDEQMPPKGARLSSAEIAVVRQWIEEGAAWPDQPGVGVSRSSHWSFQPIRRPAVPPVKHAMHVRNPIDNFILAKLEEAGLEPSPPADRVTLARRLSLDLVGLLPEGEQVDRFVKDARADAYDRLVQELLASPHFGERWGRHWLDLARYADSDGYEKDQPRPYAWRFRDWVIDAFNRDLPFDRFTIEQIAGDLLPGATLEQKIATGFHRNTLKNLEGGVDQEEYRVKAIVDRVATTGTVWLGLTVGCAECHSHKYDPITQREFYGLFGFFNSADDFDMPAPLPDEAAAYQKAKAAYDAHHAPLVQALEDARSGLAERQAAWEARHRGSPLVTQGWQRLDVQGVLSAAGSGHVREADGSVRLTGASPETDVVSVSAVTGLKGVTAFRLEVLPDPSLPSNGPGRADNGNFVLTDFQASAGPAGDAAKLASLEFASASADYSQPEFPAAHAIAPKKGRKGPKGWAVGGPSGKAGVKRSAIFVLKQPLIAASDSTALVVALRQLYGGKHTIGRFRLSATTAAAADIPKLLPEDIAPLLAMDPSRRSPEQSKALADYYASIDSRVTIRKAAVEAHAKTAPAPPATLAPVFAERKSPRATHLHLRGDFLRKGDKVEPHTPAVLHPLSSADASLGRLGLARWLVDPANPLTARVAVNRVWQTLFGRGLVATENDFGTQGERPSHPELLDWLADEFQRLGWSRKKLIALILDSATYRQSSAMRADLMDRDPKNVLLARQSRLRLEAEGVRDLYLAASGLLDARIGGPSVRPPLPSGVAELGYANSIQWAESKGADRYRRGMYIFFQRTVPYPMLMTFDAPDSNVTCTRRERSNTPLQALTTLNDPVFVECSQALASRVLREARPDPADRLDRLFMICLSRRPEPAERDRLRALHDELLFEYAKNEAAAKELPGAYRVKGTIASENAVFVALSRAVLNLDEFVNRE